MELIISNSRPGVKFMESLGKAIRFLRIKRHTKEIKLEEMTDKSKTDVNLCKHFIHYNVGKYLKYNTVRTTAYFRSRKTRKNFGKPIGKS